MPRVASPVAQAIGALIEQARLEKEMTQDQLAANSQIDSANIRSYISGRATPSVQTLVRIAWALDVDPGQLLRGLTPEIVTPSAKQ